MKFFCTDSSMPRSWLMARTTFCGVSPGTRLMISCRGANARDDGHAVEPAIILGNQQPASLTGACLPALLPTWLSSQPPRGPKSYAMFKRLACNSGTLAMLGKPLMLNCPEPPLAGLQNNPTGKREGTGRG